VIFGQGNNLQERIEEMKTILSLVAVVILASAGYASAAITFGVDYGAPGQAVYSSPGVLGEAFTGHAGTDHVFVSGSVDVTCDLDGPVGGSAGGYTAALAGSPNALFADGLEIGNNGPAPTQGVNGYIIRATVKGLAPNTPYQVAVYAGSEDTTKNPASPALANSQLVTFGDVGGTGAVQVVDEDSAVPNYRSSFILLENYALSTETSDATGKLIFLVQGGPGARPLFNGFGISDVIPVPEPATGALLLGGLSLLGARRRTLA
jgi:hypothetical protein